MYDGKQFERLVSLVLQLHAVKLCERMRDVLPAVADCWRDHLLQEPNAEMVEGLARAIARCFHLPVSWRPDLDEEIECEECHASYRGPSACRPGGRHLCLTCATGLLAKGTAKDGNCHHCHDDPRSFDTFSQDGGLLYGLCGKCHDWAKKHLKVES